VIRREGREKKVGLKLPKNLHHETTLGEKNGFRSYPFKGTDKATKRKEGKNVV